MRKRTTAQAVKKVRDHLKRCGNQEIIPTDRMISHWWSVLNQAVFDGVLPRPVGMVAKRVIQGYGEAFPIHDDNVEIRIHNEKPMSRNLFIQVLVHEMVHQYEQHTLGVMTHGQSFFEWKDHIMDRIGVPLTREI